jgi:hypothetical protein
MDKSSLVKLVWIVAFGAILVAVLALQRPEARVVTQSHRVRMVDQPVAIDLTGEVRGPKAAEPVRPAEPPKLEPPRPRAMVLGADKIVHQGETANGRARASEPATEPIVERGAKAAAPGAPEAHPAPTIEAPASSP